MDRPSPGLIQVSRPILWPVLPLVYFLGMHAADAPMYTTAIVQMLLLTFPMNLIGCGLNDIFDYESDRRSPRRRSIWGAVVGAFGLAAFSVGTVLGFVADRKYDESLDECRADDESLCSPAGVERRQEAQDVALASAVALGGGGALLVTGVILYFTAPSSAVPAETSSVPTMTRRGGVLTWRGTW